jgi:hypothetical protein
MGDARCSLAVVETLATPRAITSTPFLCLFLLAFILRLRTDVAKILFSPL